MNMTISQIQQVEIANLFRHCGLSDFYPKLQQVFQAVISHQAFSVIHCLPDRAELLYHTGPKKHHARLSRLLSAIKSPHQLHLSQTALFRPLKTGQFPSKEIFSFQWKHQCHLLHIHDQLVITPPSSHQSDNIWLVIDLLEHYPSFSDQQCQRVEHWLPTLEQLIRTHHQKLHSNTSLHELVYQAIEHFAKPRLTPRETELVKLMFAGYSSKQAARLLDISPATERVHRTNIYQKLEINSQCELLRCLLHNEESKPMRLAG